MVEIAGEYDLPLGAVHAALAYYYDHRAEIDESIAEDLAFDEAFRRNNPSLLRDKLSMEPLSRLAGLFVALH